MFQQLTGDGPNRLVSLQLLRKFACEVRKVMESYPSGLCFSNFAPAFRSCLGYECVVGHYGNFSKLSQLFEGIPDTAKVCVCAAVCVYVCLCLSGFMCVYLCAYMCYVYAVINSSTGDW